MTEKVKVLQKQINEQRDITDEYCDVITKKNKTKKNMNIVITKKGKVFQKETNEQHNLTDKHCDVVHKKN